MRGTLGRGLSWDGGGGVTTRFGLTLGVVWMTVAMALPVMAAPAPTTEPVDVIVRERNPGSDAAERLVASLGGEVGETLAVIGGFTAGVPESALPTLSVSPVIAGVTPDSTVELHGGGWGTSVVDLAGLDPYDHPGSLYWITRETAARTFWESGVTGAGVDVALIDTGVNRVAGLDVAGKVIDGADLSFESQSDELAHRDTNGHGTHMAGIIAGRDAGISGSLNDAAKDSFVGVAPDARIVNVKVGSADGAVDVSQVIAAIDWVVEHRQDNGMNIRVLNLSFGTDSTQSYLLDPLAFAVEQAWRNDIVVVVAAGNDGNDRPLRMPAADPFVVTVGSVESSGRGYDTLSDFSNCGDDDRGVDLLAPGRSVTSLRVPGSHADVTAPDAEVNGRFFLGSGTSQAAAVVSGAAALFAQSDPSLGSDEIKARLLAAAKKVKGTDKACAGAGVVDVDAFAGNGKTPRIGNVTQEWMPALGLGSLEASRGSDHLVHEGMTLEGEQDIFGNEFIAPVWAFKSATQTVWDGGDWNGVSWSGGTWSGGTWSGVSWSGLSWSGVSWSGLSWSGGTWSGVSWSGVSWSGGTWSGSSWS